MIELLLRIGFSLLVVLGLMWGLAKIARRPLAKRGAGTGLAVLSRQQLTRNSSVAVVQVADRALILGVTEGQVSMLAEADLATVRRELDEPVRRDRLPRSRPAGPVTVPPVTVPPVT
ncbi:MAG: flagellar protein FliO/FliZ, partial [Micromonosporaceae bacterium]